MRTTLKIVVPLIVSVAAVSLLFAVYQVRRERRMLRNDLSRRAEILAESLQESVEPLFERGAQRNMQRLVERFGQRERLNGAAVYDDGTAIAITPGLPRSLHAWPAIAAQAAALGSGTGGFGQIEQTFLYTYAVPLHRDGRVAGALALFHDAAYIETQVSRTMRDSLVNAGIQT